MGKRFASTVKEATNVVDEQDELFLNLLDADPHFELFNTRQGCLPFKEFQAKT